MTDVFLDVGFVPRSRLENVAHLKTSKLLRFLPIPVFLVTYYGEGLDAGPLQVGAVSVGFCWFSWLLVVSLGFPAGLFTLPALF